MVFISGNAFMDIVDVYMTSHPYANFYEAAKSVEIMLAEDGIYVDIDFEYPFI